MKNNVLEIAYSWYGLPQYGAKLIKTSIDSLGKNCAIIASRPNVPVQGMERVLKQPVHWVNADCPITWGQLGLDIPKVFVQSGWNYPAFSSLGNEVKAAGGHVIGLSDANWRGDFRQLVLGPIAFHMFYRRHFDGMVVPGLQGQRLMRYFGMRSERVLKGMYAADESVFSLGPPLCERPKEFLFVGQFIKRKYILELARTFLRFLTNNPEWRLRLCGSGELLDAIPKSPNIIVEPFVQPEELVKRYHGARFLVLPSITEAWGLVVHEATLCGCALILSNAIGSADDLAHSDNSICFKTGDEDELLRALNVAATRDESWLTKAQRVSRNISSEFSLQHFANAIATLVGEFN